MKATTSKYIEVKASGIHNKGIFARCDIPKGAYIIEYVGEHISKREAAKRGIQVLEHSKTFKECGAVYIFKVNRSFDIDGNVEWNTARYINHSCEPNCEALNDEDRIWIVAARDIKEGEELSYNYGYALEDFEEHPCRCGSPNCVGYIVDEDAWPRLKRILKRRGKSRQPVST